MSILIFTVLPRRVGEPEAYLNTLWVVNGYDYAIST